MKISFSSKILHWILSTAWFVLCFLPTSEFEVMKYLKNPWNFLRLYLTFSFLFFFLGKKLFHSNLTEVLKNFRQVYKELWRNKSCETRWVVLSMRCNQVLMNQTLSTIEAKKRKHQVIKLGTFSIVQQFSCITYHFSTFCSKNFSLQPSDACSM